MPHKGDYEVGYGKPPKDTQFKPGQSGNSKGRPKGPRNTAMIIREALDEQVTILERGRSRKMTAFEAMIRVLRKNALSGNDKAIGRILEMRADLDAADEIRSEARKLDSSERQILIDALLGADAEEEEQP